MTTKRVESLRAPCLDASSTLATSTSKRAIFSLFFRFGGSVVQPVAVWATCLRGDVSQRWRIASQS